MDSHGSADSSDSLDADGPVVEREPVLCDGGGSPIGPAEILSQEIDEIADRAEDQRQRSVDLELYDELALSNFSGPGYALFAKQIAGYGLGVMRAWIVTGQIFSECAKQGCRLSIELEPRAEHDVSSLANDTVASALIDFREKGLRGGGWQPEAGRSLRTYFVTGCVYAFPNIYRSWQRERERWRRTVGMNFPPDEAGIFDTAGPTDVAAEVLLRLEVDAVYAGLPAKQRTMLLLHSRGYTHAEIAELMGEKSPRAVEAVLYRVRQANQNSSGGEGEGSA
jgi:DNA-directed RNA polymerase specialized sigma24 family protein